MIKELYQIVKDFFPKSKEEHNWWKSLDKDWKRILRYNLYHQKEYSYDNASRFNHYLHNNEELKDILSLKKLYARSSWISDITPISKLTNLESLELPLNRISDIQPLKNLLDIEYINLVSNKIFDLKPLQRLSILNHLRLDHNEITDIKPLQNLTNLVILILNGNNISNINPLERLTNLKELQLFDNPINIEDIERLRKTLPNCKIHHNSK